LTELTVGIHNENTSEWLQLNVFCMTYVLTQCQRL